MNIKLSIVVVVVFGLAGTQKRKINIRAHNTITIKMSMPLHTQHMEEQNERAMTTIATAMTMMTTLVDCATLQ